MERIRDIAEQDRVAVLEIFNHYVRDGFAAFPEEEAGPELFAMLLGLSRAYPVLALEDAGGALSGWGMLRPYSQIASFRRTANIAYFLRPEACGSGAGTRLLEVLCERARAMGVDTLVAEVSDRNGASLAFHARRGFVERGRLEAVGRKRGQDFGVVLLQLAL